MPVTKPIDFIKDAQDITRGLKESRICAGYSQTEFARLMGKSQGWVSSVEKGKTNISIKRMCFWLDVCERRAEICAK